MRKAEAPQFDVININRKTLDRLLDEDLTEVRTTFFSCFLAPEERRAELRQRICQAKIDLHGYLIFIRQDHSWSVMGISDVTVYHQMASLPDFLWSTNFTPADDQLMEKASQTETTQRGVWGLIAVGILNDTGEISPPIIFGPRDLSPEEALRVMLRVEEMRRVYLGIN